jgi:uncharacterized membrane protein YfhO
MGKKRSSISSTETKSDEIISSDQIGTKTFKWKNWYSYILLSVLWVVCFQQVLSGSGHLWEDMIEESYPQRIFARNAMSNFEFPHWNPYMFNGMPFFATQTPGALYPTNIILSFIRCPDTVFWYLIQFAVIAHILLAGFFMHLFLRYKGHSQKASILGAISFMFSGSLIAHLIHPFTIETLAWLPLIILFIDKGITQKKIAFTSLAGILIGISALAGQPQFFFYLLLFCSFYSLYLWIVHRKMNPLSLLQLSLPFIIGICIGTIQILPTVELNPYTFRANWSFEMASEGSMSPLHLLVLIIPKLFGAWTGSMPTSKEGQIPSFWLTDSPHAGYYTYWETCFYSGIIIIILAAVSFYRIKKDPLIPFMAFWCLGTILIAMGSYFPLFKALFTLHVPGFTTFRNPSRILVSWNFVLPFLAAISLQNFSQIFSEKKGKRLLYIVGGFLLVIGLISGTGILAKMVPDMQVAERSAWAATQGLLLLLHASVFLILIYTFQAKWIKEPTFYILLIAGLSLDMITFAYGQHVVHSKSAPSEFKEQKDLVKAIQDESKKGLFRSNTRQFILEPGATINRQTNVMLFKRTQGMVDNIQLTEGYAQLRMSHYMPQVKAENFKMLLDLLNVKFFINPEYGTSSQQLILANNDCLPRIKMFYSAKTIENDSLIATYMNDKNFNYARELVLSEKPQLNYSDTGDVKNNINITKYTNNKIEINVSTDKPGLLWLSEIWYPAWKAKVDGKVTKVYKADFSFRAIDVPSGNHKITMYFDSDAFRYGMIISLTALFASICIIGFNFRQFSLPKKTV